MHQWYIQELFKLNQEAKAFAKRYPHHSSALKLTADQDKDPFVERLLEGVAYLTGSIHQRIDHFHEDFVQLLLSHLAPELLKVVPATGIIQFHPKVYGLQQFIHKGMQIKLWPDREKSKTYIVTTASELTIYPINITNCHFMTNNVNGLVMTWQLHCHDNVTLSQCQPNKLKVYLGGDDIAALQRYQLFMDQLLQVEVKIGEKILFHTTDQQAVTAAHFHIDDLLLPSQSPMPLGWRLLKEYFHCKQKYFFINLAFFSKIQWPVSSQQATIVFTFKPQKHQLYPLADDDFLLNCLPVVNLFHSTSEPLRVQGEKVFYPIVAEHSDNDISIYDIVTVRGRYEHHENTVLFQEDSPKAVFSYHQHLYQKRIEDGSIALAFDGLAAGEKLTVSCDVLVYQHYFLDDNNIAHQQSFVTDLQSMVATLIGQINPLSDSPTPELQLKKLLAALSFHYHCTVSATNLKLMLSLVCPVADAHHQQLIAAIVDVSQQAVSKPHRGFPLSGQVFRIVLQQNTRITSGQIYLFGQLLQHFFEDLTAVGQFVETVIICQTSGEEFRWTQNYNLLSIV